MLVATETPPGAGFFIALGQSAPRARAYVKDVSCASHLLSLLTNSIKETCDTVPQLTESGVCR
ncbi:hypothetical protein EMIT053CA3_20192 [Pseudomonas donghuensis]